MRCTQWLFLWRSLLMTSRTHAITARPVWHATDERGGVRTEGRESRWSTESIIAGSFNGHCDVRKLTPVVSNNNSVSFLSVTAREVRNVHPLLRVAAPTFEKRSEVWKLDVCDVTKGTSRRWSQVLVPLTWQKLQQSVIFLMDNRWLNLLPEPHARTPAGKHMLDNW